MMEAGKDPPVSRKNFLRLSLLFAGSALAACQSKLPDADTPAASPAPTAAPSPSPSAVPSPTPALPAMSVSLPGAEIDVWGWTKEVKGTLSGAEACREIAVSVNGQEFPGVLSGAIFSSDVILKEGENIISAICRLETGLEVRSNMIHYRERLRKAPKARIEISLDGDAVHLDGRRSTPAENEQSQLIDHIWSARTGNPGSLSIADPAAGGTRLLDRETSRQTLTIQPPETDGEYYVNLEVKDASGRSDSSTTYFVVENGEVRIPDYATENPAWVDRAIVYGVIPRNFGSPGFRAIRERLDDLADLGIDALWLAPVNVSPPGDYGYAVVDYFELNPQYGTKEEFHQMVQEAHRRGIRVLMDFVPNHSSAEHPYFLDAQKRGAESNYWNFYDRDDAGNFTYYFNWTHLPNLDYDNPEVQRWMIEAFAYWVREFEVDGFRVDVAWGVKERKPEFWTLWRQELKRIKPDLMLLAEASARDPFYFENGFDVAYDWTDQLGKWAWELVWDSYKNRLLTYNLEAALTNRPDGFHSDALIFRFLNNNDTGERFITRFGEAMTRVATALLLTLPGVPCIYTGDEVGAEFQPYQNPEPLSWEEKYSGLRAYHQKLIGLRKSTPSLHSRSWTPLELKPAPQEVYGYWRTDGQGGGAPVLVLLNFVEEDARAIFQVPEEMAGFAETGILYDLLNDEELRLVKDQDGAYTVPLPALSARILAL